MTKKIGIITQVYKPEIGAAQTRLSEMASGLQSFGWDVSVITAMPNYPYGKVFEGYRGKIIKKDLVDGIEVRRYWISPSNSSKAIPRLISWISFSFSVFLSLPFLRKRRFDYILVQSPPMLVGISSLILNWICGAKMILNVSDVWPLTAKELGAISEGFLYQRFEGIEKLLYKKSFLCIGQSGETMEHLAKNGAKRTYLFQNGVDPSRFSPVKERSSTGPIKIVYAGILGVAQGVVDICRAIDFGDFGAEMHIYGAGPEQLELEQFLSENPDRGIYYHGHMEREKIASEMSKYTVSLIPLVKNLYGAVPSKIYESMAAGLPILYSGEGEARTIIKDHNLGWISHAKDYEGLKKNIKGLASMKEDIDEKKKNCIRAANETFNRNIQIEKLHKHLVTLMN